MLETPRFHLAFPVTDLEATRHFFADVPGCRTACADRVWINLDFFGQQITAHLCEAMPVVPAKPVDGKAVPVRHWPAGGHS